MLRWAREKQAWVGRFEGRACTRGPRRGAGATVWEAFVVVDVGWLVTVDWSRLEYSPALVKFMSKSLSLCDAGVFLDDSRHSWVDCAALWRHNDGQSPLPGESDVPNAGADRCR